MGGGKVDEGVEDRDIEAVEMLSFDSVDDADSSGIHPLGESGSVSTVNEGGSQSEVSKETGTEAGTSGGTEAPSEGYEVVYLKDNVSTHPAQHASGLLGGRLRLIKQGPSLFMQTWIPGACNINVDRASERERMLYEIRSISLAEMRSIRRHTPPLGLQYIIIVLQSGLAFPTLYFHNGGVREFLNALKEHESLVRSATDANVYLVNDSQDPLQKSLTSLHLTVSPAPARLPSRSSSSKESSVAVMPQPEDTPGDSSLSDRRSSDSSIPMQSNRKQKDPVALQVLEKFSLVTKFARETTSQLFGKEGRMLGVDDLYYMHGPAPKQVQNFLSISNLPTPVKLIEGSDELKPEEEKKAEEEPSTNMELVDGTENALVWGRARPPHLGQEEWISFMDSEGRVVDPKALKKRIFHGGVEQGLRSEVWKFLLEYFPFDSTWAEREFLMMQKKEEYLNLKAQWQSVSEQQAKRFAKYRDRKHRVEKDVVRTDRELRFYEGDENGNVTLLRDILVTYSFYNFDLGYCQGMSDILSPILYVIGDEAEAFWCFAALMDRMAPNFQKDQNGMHSQLLALSKLVQLLDGPLHDYFKQHDCLNYFFCFRWILIQFKREFEYENVLRLWEVLWSHHLSEHFHLYMCVALLKRHRWKIMDEQMEFDTLLKFINMLSGQIPLEATLRDAEALCLFAGDRGVECIPSGTPPSLPKIIDQNLVEDAEM